MTLRAALRTGLAAFSIFLVTEVACAGDAALMQQFDVNGNGIIDPEEATPSFVNYFNQIVLPGLGEKPEKDPLPIKEGTNAVTPLGPLLESAPVVSPVISPVFSPVVSGSVEPDLVVTVAPAPVLTPKYSHALLLRGDAMDSSIPQEGASLDNVSGAFVSYSNDVRQSTEEWQVKGAILYPVRFEKGDKEEMNGARLTAYTFVPSVTFDRKFDSEDVASELDTLTFEVGSEWEFSGGPWFDKQYLRLGPFYATDFSFESAVTGLEMEYEALNTAWGLGEPVACFYKRFKCEWSAKLLLGAGKTLEAGDKVNLLEEEDFITFGPELSLALSPTFKPLDRLQLDASWYYIEDISGDSGAADQLEAGISFGLDANGHVRLRTEYRHGDLRYTRDKITIITTGLEVKF